MARPKTKPERTTPKRYRAPNKIKSTPASRDLYEGFLKPFLVRYTLLEDQSSSDHGVQAFFGVETRATLWCKATESFTLPGILWQDTSHPFNVISFTKRRKVKKDDGLVVRIDKALPDHTAVEFDEQVFLLTKPQLEFLNSKVKIKA